MGAERKIFSYSQVSAHKTSDDCWVIINGKVYNVTNYLDEHPGGDEVILGQAGSDASQEFEDVGHGSAARLMLDEFYVGEVDPNTEVVEPIDTTPTLAKASKDKSKESTKFIYFILSLGIVGLALAILLYNFSS